MADLDLSKLKVSSSPHIKTEDSTQQIMLDVICALIPALVVSIFVFGWRALVMVCASVAGCIFFEWLYRVVLKKPCVVGDLSAVVTGILLAFCIPVSAPIWMLLIGDAFAIVICKQLYGGIGKNPFNPALAARAFLMACWPVLMTTWVGIRTALPLFATPDVVSTATPLSELSQFIIPQSASLANMALGMTPGCIGETSALALLAGGLFLLYRRVITLTIPLSFIGTVAVLSFIFPHGNNPLEFMGAQLLSGGLMLGAIFMATDYATSPVTPKGQLIYGIGCGALTVFIRFFGSYPEGVSYAILIMNACVHLIEKATRPRKFGYVKPVKPPKAVKEAKVNE